MTTRRCLNSTVLFFFMSSAALTAASPRLPQIPADGIQTNTVVCNTVVPVIGLQTTTVSFLHQTEQADPEKDPYELRYRLWKVTVRYNIAANLFFSLAYYFDAGGRLRCHTRQVTEMDGRKRLEQFIYRQGKLQLYRHANGAQEITVQSGFSPQTAKKSLRALQNSSRYQTLFRQLLAAEHFDKALR